MLACNYPTHTRSKVISSVVAHTKVARSQGLSITVSGNCRNYVGNSEKSAIFSFYALHGQGYKSCVLTAVSINPAYILRPHQLFQLPMLKLNGR